MLEMSILRKDICWLGRNDLYKTCKECVLYKYCDVAYLVDRPMIIGKTYLQSDYDGQDAEYKEILKQIKETTTDL